MRKKANHFSQNPEKVNTLLLFIHNIIFEILAIRKVKENLKDTSETKVSLLIFACK